MKISHLIPFHVRRVPETHRTYDPFNLLRQEIDSLFENRDLVGFEGLQMKLDVSENNTGLIVTAELPGVEEKDISACVSDNILIIEGEKKMQRDEKQEKYHLTERSYGSFRRSLQLPFNPKPEEINAHFKNGVLTLEIKRPENVKEKGHTISIKTP